MPGRPAGYAKFTAQLPAIRVSPQLDMLVRQLADERKVAVAELLREIIEDRLDNSAIRV